MVSILILDKYNGQVSAFAYHFLKYLTDFTQQCCYVCRMSIKIFFLNATRKRLSENYQPVAPIKLKVITNIIAILIILRRSYLFLSKLNRSI